MTSEPKSMLIFIILASSRCTPVVTVVQIKEKIESLAAAKTVLLSLWEDRQVEYEHCLDTQQFIKEAQQAGAWIALREAFLANEELGVSMGVCI